MTIIQKPQPMEGTLRGGLYIKSIPSCYTPEQLSLYLSRIGFLPKDEMEQAAIESGQFPTTVDNLERLMLLHLLTFPFENTSIHYEPVRDMELDPMKLYHRFIYDGKGSYCHGQSRLFLNVLRGLGYRAYNVVARVNEDRALPTPRYGVQAHLLILVQAMPDSNITYVADIGFGMGPMRPMLLSDSEKSVVKGTTATERYRVAREVDARSSLECRDASYSANHQTWILQVQRDKDDTKNGSENKWITVYSFSEEEFYEKDIINASLRISQGQGVGPRLFRNNVVASKFFLVDEDGSFVLDPEKTADELANTDVLDRDFGMITLIGKELKSASGRKSDTKMLKTEDERIEVLKDVFGVVINEDGKKCIKDWTSAIEGGGR